MYAVDAVDVGHVRQLKQTDDADESPCIDRRQPTLLSDSTRSSLKKQGTPWCSSVSMSGPRTPLDVSFLM